MEPYKIEKISAERLEFVSEADVRYACYFLSYSQIFGDYGEVADDIYGINLDVISGDIAKDNDPRIGITVVQILQEFLVRRENAVVYVCDNTDGKGVLRKRKFDSWFRAHDEGTIIKIDGHLWYEDLDIYNALLIHKDNPEKNRFIEVFLALNQPNGK